MSSALPFKPMLGASLDGVSLESLRYPLLASPKLDGVRCLVWEGVAYSRNLKPIRNRAVQRWAAAHHNLDGELLVGDPTAPGAFNRTQSGVMSTEGEPDFRFWAFDRLIGPQRGRNESERWEFAERLCDLQSAVSASRLEYVEHVEIRGPQALEYKENQWLAAGYEGVMLRDPRGPYKHGRSTVREGYLLKLKRFTDGEGVVVGLEEGAHNDNAAFRDELGRLKRTSHTAGKRPAGVVGTLLVRTEEWGVLRVAPGVMTHAERERYWMLRSVPTDSEGLLGKRVHWRSFGYGVKDKPRFPRFYGLREKGT